MCQAVTRQEGAGRLFLSEMRNAEWIILPTRHSAYCIQKLFFRMLTGRSGGDSDHRNAGGREGCNRGLAWAADVKHRGGLP